MINLRHRQGGAATLIVVMMLLFGVSSLLAGVAHACRVHDLDSKCFGSESFLLQLA